MHDPAATARKDNLLGICHAIGEDFGFNPFWLRLALAVGIIAWPEIVLSFYAVLGAAVLASRLLTRGKAATKRPSATVTPLPARAAPPLLRRAA